MRIVGNILWLILGGLWMAIAHTLAGLIAFVFIITIPFGIQSFKLAGFALWPFGRVMVARPKSSTGLSAIGNIIWLVFGGLWLALGHLFAALINAITIIGIPFAIAHLRLAGASLTPFGHTVLSIKEARDRQLAFEVAVEPLG